MEKETNMNFLRYDVYIVDVDGTLYFKRPMQMRMAFELVTYYALRFFRLKELLLLRDYRKMRDKDEISDKEGFENIIILELSGKYGFSQKKVSEIIEKWILKKPVDILFKCRDKKLISFLNRQKNDGKKIFVYSDYPAADKCRALGINSDNIYWPDKKRISVLKPSAQGINYIIEENGLDKQSVIFIGDRYEKDGKCAQNGGVDYLILKGSRFDRERQYKSLDMQGDF